MEQKKSLAKFNIHSDKSSENSERRNFLNPTKGIFKTYR